MSSDEEFQQWLNDPAMQAEYQLWIADQEIKSLPPDQLENLLKTFGDTHVR
jgi:hypothetical protein